MKWNWRKIVLIFIVIGAVAGVGGYYSGNWLLDKLRSDTLEQHAARIQLAVEKYAFDHSGSYPQKMQDLLDENYLTQWPSNPYSPSGEPMLPIPGGSPAHYGDFVYLAFGPVIFISAVEELMEGGKGTSSVEGDDGPGAVSGAGLDDPPTEVDQYFLIFYGPGTGVEYVQFTRDQPPEFDGIEWDQVGLVLTAGAPLER